MDISSVSDPAARLVRMPAQERRELILEAATAVFAERGYAGTTTAQVAQAAGISQPYVVRMFGTKEKLFLEALDRSLGKLMDSFRSVVADYDGGRLAEKVAALGPERGTGRQAHLKALLSFAYADLIQDRGILLMLMQSFISGHEPVIGARAREGFVGIYRLLRDEAGMGEEVTRDFLAHGMLMNTLISLRLTDLYGQDAGADELLKCTMGAKLPLLLAHETPRAN
ncbi:TetR/AcrR family transcriptional regulator [Specibacter sp. AOP5-B1-6]|uniref:TetR/AcrR family transcriptional regulator n=1 Tax=Specibacter sp. AOP5-B1-6 TaxID=3457653 RepID=UPI003FB754E8